MFKRLAYLLLLFPLSCIEPYELDIPEGPQLLTVDGFINTEPGPHQIRITRSDTYGSVFQGLIRPVSRATLAIRDSDGNVVFLTESEERGIYETPASFKARIGVSYSLQIELLDGKTYTSLPERVNSVPQIDTLTYRMLRIPTSNRLQDKIGVQITAHFRDPSDQNNFYYWRLGNADYVLVTNPELYVTPRTAEPPLAPAPKPCCNICFISERLSVQPFQVLSDAEFNGLSQQVPVGFIQDNGIRFKRTYKIDVMQMGVSAEAHRFLRLVQQQVGLTGSVFDPPPANIRGNIISLDDPNETVLGFFIAASVDKRSIYIQNERLEILAPQNVIPDDCLTVRGAVLNPPSGWNPPSD